MGLKKILIESGNWISEIIETKSLITADFLSEKGQWNEGHICMYFFLKGKWI